MTEYSTNLMLLLNDDYFSQRAVHNTKLSIFIGNLHFHTTEEELRDFIASKLAAGHDGVISVRIVHDRVTGEGKGFAFVQMSTAATLLGELSLFVSYDHMTEYSTNLMLLLNDYYS
jgi:hypothetical protein